MEIKKVGVVGAGLMGHGIAQVTAQAGYDVVVRELSQEKLDGARAKIEKQLARLVEKEKIDQGEADSVAGRIQWTLDYADLGGSDLVIEAITEDLGQKIEMWREVSTQLPEHAIVASNTSSLAVIDQAVITDRPDRFLGLHFFNPVQVMALLEVIRTVTTSDETYAAGLAFGQSLGKTCVNTKDKTGFIVNRILVPYLYDSVRAFEEGVGSIEEIDIAMRAGAGVPMGPITLADFVGLDTLASIGDAMFDEFREKRFSAPPTLRKLVAAGYFGRKSGRGFYDYSGEKPVAVDPGV